MTIGDVLLSLDVLGVVILGPLLVLSLVATMPRLPWAIFLSKGLERDAHKQNSKAFLDLLQKLNLHLLVS